VAELIGASGLQRADFVPYYAYFHRIDPLSQHGLRCPPATAFTTEELLDRAALGESDFRHTEIYADWLNPHGIARVLGSQLPLGEGELVALAFYRDEQARPFGRAECTLLDQLLPHLRRALRIALRIGQLDAERFALQSALDGLSIGVALLGDKGRVLETNRALREIAAQRDGLALARDGLVAEKPAATAAMRAGEAVTLALPRPSGRRALQVLVAPLRADSAEGAFGERARTLVVVSDPDVKPVRSFELLSGLYGLTAAEGRVAARLAAGTSLGEIADALGIRTSTARNHLKRIFEKTGTHRQGELVRLLNGGLGQALPGSGRDRT
jgi:DNA-binding CsgD family transcriptional regulator